MKPKLVWKRLRATVASRAWRNMVAVIDWDDPRKTILRQGEAAEVEAIFSEYLGSNLIVVDAADQFLQALKGISDPEEK